MILDLERDDVREDEARIFGSEMGRHIPYIDDLNIFMEWKELKLKARLPSLTEVSMDQFSSYPLPQKAIAVCFLSCDLLGLISKKWNQQKLLWALWIHKPK